MSLSFMLLYVFYSCIFVVVRDVWILLLSMLYDLVVGSPLYVRVLVDRRSATLVLDCKSWMIVGSFSLPVSSALSVEQRLVL